MACYTYRMHSTPPSKNSVFVKVNQVTGHMGIGHTGHFVQCFTRVTLANDPASAPVYKTLSHRSWQCKLSEAANYHTIITDESNVKYKKKAKRHHLSTDTKIYTNDISSHHGKTPTSVRHRSEKRKAYTLYPSFFKTEKSRKIKCQFCVM